MRRLTPFKLALIIGCALEGSLIGLTFAVGRFGPCGPADLSSGFLMFLHLPGFLLAAPIGSMSVRPGTEVIRNIMAIVILVVINAAAFTGLAYIFTRRLRCYKR